MNKLVRITTVPISLDKLLSGQLKYMSEHDFDVFMVSSWDDKVPLIAKRENSTFITVNMNRAISPLKDIISLFRMIAVLRKLRPQIVHTHTPKAGLLGMLAAWLVSVPVRVHTVAGLPLMETTGFKRKILEYVEWLTYRCAVKVYPNSKNLQSFIVENRFCKPGKLKVIGNGSSNGIDVNYFKANDEIQQKAEKLKRQFGITEENFVFVFVGRMVKDKGIEELTQAFSELNKLYPHLRLLLVGPMEPELDPLSDACLSLISNNDNIIPAGFQNDVRPYLAVSNVLAFPSYREGFPNVPMQAGCFNLPSIVTDINGCNEIIHDKVNGLIVPVKDAEALKNAMELIITDQTLYLRLKDHARRLIVENYDQKKMWELILSEYQYHLKIKNIVS
jgi:glycosyltransferase involved in cell wall biosynthesis